MGFRALGLCVCLCVPQVTYALGAAHFTWDGLEDTGQVPNLAQPANGGTLNGGASIGPGRIGDGALVLNGLDGHMVIAGLEDYTFLNDYTFAAWVKTTEGGIIIAKANADCPAVGRDPNHDFGTKQFGIMPDGRLTTTSSGLAAELSIDSVKDGEWHHVAVTVDWDVDFGNVRLPQIALYIDGQLDTLTDDVTRGLEEYPAALRHAPDSGGIFAVGRGTFHSNRHVGVERNTLNDRNPTHFIGSIDDLWVFEGALDADQIATLATNAPVDCGVENDTVATSIAVTPPVDGANGLVAISVEASDASGDAIWYRYEAHRAEGGPETLTPDAGGLPLAYGPTRDRTVTLELPSGTWTITCRVFDDLLADGASCPGQAANAPESMVTSEAFVLERRRYAGRRVSSFGNGWQYWFDLEDYDQGLPSSAEPAADGRTIDDFVESVPSDLAFGNALRRVGVPRELDDVNPSDLSDKCNEGFLQGEPGYALVYDFDIVHAGGEEGRWILWTRLVNPERQSGLAGVESDPQDAPFFDEMLMPDPATGLYPSWPLESIHRVFATTEGPGYRWASRQNEGQGKELIEGAQRLLLNHRQGSTSRFLDVAMWTNDPDYVPSDADYLRATPIHRFRRGDCNSDGHIDVSDGVKALSLAFFSDTNAPCFDACDADVSGALDITNAIFFFNAVFLGGAPIRGSGEKCDFATPLLGCEDVTAGCSDVAVVPTPGEQ